MLRDVHVLTQHVPRTTVQTTGTRVSVYTSTIYNYNLQFLQYYSTAIKTTYTCTCNVVVINFEDLRVIYLWEKCKNVNVVRLSAE